MNLLVMNLIVRVCSCVFVWRLDTQMTNTMRRRRSSKVPGRPERCGRSHQIRWARLWRLGRAEVDVLTWPLSLFRRETFITVPSFPPQAREEEEEAARGTPVRQDCVQGDGGD